MNTFKNSSYYFFAFLRIFLVFLPQKGYIHPDEFFQSLEILSGEDIPFTIVFYLKSFIYRTFF